MELTPANFRDGTIVVRQSKTEKVVCRRLHPATLAAIEATEPSGRHLVWPWPYGRELWFEHFRKLLKAADLKGTFKYLRRSSGTLIEAVTPGAGQTHLSHSSRATFDAHYHDVSMTADSLPMPPSLDKPPVNGNDGGL